MILFIAWGMPELDNDLPLCFVLIVAELYLFELLTLFVAMPTKDLPDHCVLLV